MGFPTIGDSVYMGPGACIIGRVSIGSDVAVGAHAVVVRDVMDGEVVAGNPARQVSGGGAKDYINYTVGDEGVKSEISDYERKQALWSGS
jgi:serine O-acetyltransferase